MLNFFDEGSLNALHTYKTVLVCAYMLLVRCEVFCRQCECLLQLGCVLIRESVPLPGSFYSCFFAGWSRVCLRASLQYIAEYESQEKEEGLRRGE